MIHFKKLSRNLQYRLNFAFSVFVSVMTICICTYLILLDFQEILVSKAADKAQSLSISVTEIIESDIGNYEKLAMIEDFENTPIDEVYYNKMHALFKQLKKEINVTYLYTVRKKSATEIYYILDGEESNSDTYTPPGSTEALTIDWKILFEGEQARSYGLLDYGKWGTLISGCAPIHSTSTTIIGYTCVDIDISSATGRYVLLTLIIIFIASLTVVYLLLRVSRRFVRESHIDLLTKLSNREAALLHVTRYLKRNKIDTMILIDLNNFKGFNAIFGQSLGNYLLQDIGIFLSARFGKRNVYRYGGDEFLIILHQKSLYDVQHATALIANRFDEFWKIDLQEIRISTGIVVATKDFFSNAEESLFSLEYCMRLKKSLKDNSVAYVNNRIIDGIVRERKIVDCLLNAIKTNGFEVKYQPIYSLKDKSFTSAEALLRLYNDELGWIPPDEFIQIAERNSMIVEIGYITLIKVSEFIKELEDKKIPFTSISINLSPIQLADHNIAKRIKEIIQSHQVHPSKICFEITETAFVDDYEPIKAFMDELRNTGIQFYLDDFGNGTSNLASILGLNFEFVKLDKTLLNFTSKTKKNELMGGFIKIFSDLGINVVVEGVETKEQMLLVKNHHGDLIQGFYFSVPVTSQALIPYFMNQKRDEK